MFDFVKEVREEVGNAHFFLLRSGLGSLQAGFGFVVQDVKEVVDDLQQNAITLRTVRCRFRIFENLTIKIFRLIYVR